MIMMIMIKAACVSDQIHDYNNNNIYTQKFKKIIQQRYTDLEGELFQSLIILLK